MRMRSSAQVNLLPLYILAGVLAVVMIAGVGALVAFQVRYSGRAYPGVHLGSADLTGMSPEEIFATARQRAEYFRTPVLTLRVADRTVSMRPADFGAGLDSAATTQRALDVGRKGDLITRLREQVDTWWHGVDVAPVVLLNDDAAKSILSRIATEVRRDPRDAAVQFENGAVQEIASQTGTMLDIQTSLVLIQSAIMNGRQADLTLPLDAIQPKIANAAVAADFARRIVSQDLVIMVPKWDENDNPVAGVEAFRVRGPDLPEFVTLEQQTQDDGLHMNMTLRRDKLGAMLEPLAPAVARPVQNAHFTFDDDTSTLQNTLPSKTGRELNIEATLDAIQAALAGDQRMVTLVVNSVEPTVNANATGQQLGITRLITQATTYFKGSTAARLTNVRVAASRFHGIVIPPHATFSFNEFLGNVSTDDGFEEGLVIVGDRTIKGVGGGVCQVSTTAYQAALRAGFPIVERYPHGYRVSYYERGMGPGFDATVFSPYVDLKFVNDTEGHLLIETYFNQAAATLTFKFYGTPDDREVTFSEPVISDVTPHGPDIYEADTENKVPAGQSVKVDYAVDGARIVADRTVTRGGQVLIQEQLVSKYVPWQAVYRFGQGFTPPEGAIVR
jgi:vancomycin resistance protein YoaR